MFDLHVHSSLCTYSGERVNHAEDRICSTAMAVNTLLYIWTTGERFVSDVPTDVKDVVGNASLWLVKNAMKGKAYNAVFSGSVKSGEVS